MDRFELSCCRALLCAALGLATLDGASAAAIDPAKGTDARVDYRALTELGPWDDRNYRLTLEDLALLPAGEGDAGGAIPAFFRVVLRRAHPAQRAAAAGRYPKSAIEQFHRFYGGYLIDGKLYREVTRESGRYRVIEEAGVPDEVWQEKALGGDVRMTYEVPTAESTVKIHPLDPTKAVSGTNPGFGRRWLRFSTDGGSNWFDSFPTGTDGVCCDPSVEFSLDGAKAYATALACGVPGVCDIWFYRSDNGGISWTDLGDDTPGDTRREISFQSQADKPMLHVDKANASPFRNNLYLTWHEVNVLQLSRSTDFGNTWSRPISISSGSSELGIGSDVVTDRAGNVYYLWPTFAGKSILSRRSSDGGASFAPVRQVASTQGAFDFPIPAMEARHAFLYVSSEADLTDGPFADTLYAAWTDSTAPTGTNPGANHARIQVAFSRDGGSTWSVRTPHPTSDAATVDRFHPWIAVDGNGTVHLAFYDSSRSADRKSVDLYYTMSIDGGNTWLLPSRLNAEQSPHIEHFFQLGDYNGLDVVGSQAIATFTDNRSEIHESGDSVDVYAAAPLGIGSWRVATFTSIAAHDGYLLESSEISSVAGSLAAGDSGAQALRAGDDALDRQWRSILSFDTSSIPDFAPIIAASVQLATGSVVGGPTLSLSTLYVDQRSGFFGSSSGLELEDFSAPQTVLNAAPLYRVGSSTLSWRTGKLGSAGLSAINRTGLTQFRLRYFRDDDDNLTPDFLGFFSGDATTAVSRPRLVVVYQQTF